jgi:hypothetical protein
VIYFVARNPEPINTYLDWWRSSTLPAISTLTYEQLRSQKRAAGGTYVFSDIELLTRHELARAAQVWNALARSSVPLRLLNQPQRILRRYDLLAELHARQINTFRAYRLTELARARFPVFLRREDDHRGNLTGLLWSKDAVLDAVYALSQSQERLRGIIAVEFCDTRDRGECYARYRAYNVSGCIIPSALCFDRNWMVKQTLSLPPTDSQQRFVEANSDRAWLEEIFQIANVDYGAIDYSFEGHEPRVWEINTNPEPFREVRPDWEPFHRLFAARLEIAFQAIDDSQEISSEPLASRVHVGRRVRYSALGGERATILRTAGRIASRLTRPAVRWRQAPRRMVSQLRQRVRLRSRLKESLRPGRTLGLRVLLPSLWWFRSRYPDR